MHRLTQKGFSLIELLVVIAVAGIIIAITTTSYGTAQRHARDSRRIQDMKSMQTAFEQYYIIQNIYPNAADGTIDDAFQNAAPIDPKPTASYIINTSAQEYCLCATLENQISGNATTPTDTDCNWQSGGPLYCVANQQ